MAGLVCLGVGVACIVLIAQSGSLIETVYDEHGVRAAVSLEPGCTLNVIHAVFLHTRRTATAGLPVRRRGLLGDGHWLATRCAHSCS